LCLPGAPEFGKAEAANVLQAVLDARHHVGHKLEDGTLVNNGASDALRHADLVIVAAGGARETEGDSETGKKQMGRGEHLFTGINLPGSLT
jgi:hypothetical protein